MEDRKNKLDVSDLDGVSGGEKVTDSNYILILGHGRCPLCSGYLVETFKNPGAVHYSCDTVSCGAHYSNNNGTWYRHE